MLILASLLHYALQSHACLYTINETRSSYLRDFVTFDFLFLKCVLWVAQSVKRLTSPEVMISWLVSLSPLSGSVLTAQSLELASESMSLALSACRLLMLSLLSLSLSKINIKKIIKCVL